MVLRHGTTFTPTTGDLPFCLIGEGGEGEGEGEIEGESTCDVFCEGTGVCVYECLFGCEWPSFAAECGVAGDGEGGGQRIPLRWGLGMVRAILCNDQQPHHEGVLADYENNLATLEGRGGCQESSAMEAMVSPYRHAVAALLLVSNGIQSRVRNCLGLQCNYPVYDINDKTADEPFSDDGDLDGDGMTNADEYDNVAAWGGSMEDFIEAVTNPSSYGQPMPTVRWVGLACLAALLMFAVVLILRRKTAAKA